MTIGTPVVKKLLKALEVVVDTDHNIVIDKSEESDLHLADVLIEAVSCIRRNEARRFLTVEDVDDYE